MISIVIQPQYAYNILVATGIGFQVILIGGMASAARRKYKVDYPDMGNGRLSAKLTDEQWADFNNHQRAHYNYVEGAATAISFNLLAGLFYPRASAIFGLAYIIGRQLYAHMYMKRGPKARFYGTALFDLSLVAQLGMIIYGCMKTLGCF